MPDVHIVKDCQAQPDLLARYSQVNMVGFSELFSLLFALLGALAGVMFGTKYHFALGIVGGLVGGSLGVITGAIVWSVYDRFLEKVRNNHESQRYLLGAVWVVVSLVFFLSSFGGMIWLLNLSLR